MSVACTKWRIAADLFMDKSLESEMEDSSGERGTRDWDSTSLIFVVSTRGVEDMIGRSGGYLRSLINYFFPMIYFFIIYFDDRVSDHVTKSKITTQNHTM